MFQTAVSEAQIVVTIFVICAVVAFGVLAVLKAKNRRG